jgi:hypothetical protein
MLISIRPTSRMTSTSLDANEIYLTMHWDYYRICNEFVSWIPQRSGSRSVALPVTLPFIFYPWRPLRHLDQYRELLSSRDWIEVFLVAPRRQRLVAKGRRQPVGEIAVCSAEAPYLVNSDGRTPPQTGSTKTLAPRTH